ncbi:MAG: hypothetical protein LBS24_02165 [Clostridiales Family XIII bacterium]|nr:hypothetical protein [Clostridiales Family XIII bacterium]
MPFADTFRESLSLWGSILMPAVFVILLGSAMGVLYQEAGATNSIADWLLKPVEKVKNGDAKVVLAILMFIVFRIILGLAGFVNDAIMITMFAIAAVVFQRTDIDRRHLNAVLVISGTIGVILPGAPTMTNVMFELYLPGYDSTAYFFPRLVLMLLYIAIVCFLMLRYVKKDRMAGRRFEPGNMMIAPPDVNMPPIWLCLIPVAVVVVAYTFLKTDAWISIAFGLLSTVLCLYRYFPVMEGKTRFASVIHYGNKGAVLVPLQYLLMVLPAMVVSVSPAFEWGMQAMPNSPIPLYLSFAILSVVLVSFSGAGALPIICTAALSGYIGHGMGMYACVIIATWSCVIFDSLPTNVSIVIQSELCDCTMKKAYPTIFTTTVVATACIEVLAIVAAASGIFG